MLLRCWRLEHVQGGLPKTWGRGKWEGTGARLEGCSLPGCCGSLSGTGRAELASFPVLQWLLCLQSHPWAPVLGVVSRGNSAGSVWVCCNVLSCRVRQREALAPSKGPSPGQQGDALAAYVLCPSGLCAKPFWDGQEMTQQTPNCEALAGRASSCFAFSDSGMRSLTVFRHWRFLWGTLAVLSPSSASHQQRDSRNQGRLVNVLELMWFVPSYHHEWAEVLCPVTCLTAWWRSLWSAQVSYRKLLLDCGLGGTPGTGPFEQRQPVHQPCPLNWGGGLHHHCPHLPGLLPACATTPGWRGPRAPAQAPDSSHKRGVKPPAVSGSLKQGQLSSQPAHAASVDLFTA